MAELTPESLRAARALLRWSMKDLQERSGVAFSTINAIENGKRERAPYAATMEKLAAALTSHGIELLGDDRPGARVSDPERFAQAVATKRS